MHTCKAGALVEAETDFRRCLALPMKPKLEATVAFNLGLVAEKRSDPEAALDHFARSMALAPTKAAKKRLAAAKRLEACAVADTRTVPSTEHASWLALWRDLARQMVAKDAKMKLPLEPGADPAARLNLCRYRDEDHCKGDPPWLVGLTELDATYERRLLVVVQPTADGRLRVSKPFEIRRPEEDMPDVCQRLATLETDSWVHVSIEESCEGWEFDCGEDEDPGDFSDCDKDYFTSGECRDYVLVPDTLEQRLVVTRDGHSAGWASEGHALRYDIDFMLFDEEAVLTGRSCELVVPLP